jgi:hypothetical protein
MPLAVALAGCGGDGDASEGDGQAAAKKGPPPAEQVEQSVVAVLNTCIERSFDAQVDTAPVSAEVDRLIALYKAHDPDAPLAPSDLKATSMRQAITQVRDQVRTCSPQDEDRINEVLTSSPPPAASDADTSTGEQDAESKSTPEPGTGRRGVATISAELAPLGVDRITTGDTGPATPEIEALVDDLVTAYRNGPENRATRNRMRVARATSATAADPTRPTRSPRRSRKADKRR